MGIRKDPFESARRRASLGGGPEERRRRLSLGEADPKSWTWTRSTVLDLLVIRQASSAPEIVAIRSKVVSHSE